MSGVSAATVHELRGQPMSPPSSIFSHGRGAGCRHGGPWTEPRPGRLVKLDMNLVGYPYVVANATYLYKSRCSSILLKQTRR